MSTVLETEIQISGRAGSEIEVTLRGDVYVVMGILIKGLDPDKLQQLAGAISAELANRSAEAQAPAS